MSCMVAPRYMNWSAGTTPGTSSLPQQGASCAPNQSMAGLVVLYQVLPTLTLYQNKSAVHVFHTLILTT